MADLNYQFKIQEDDEDIHTANERRPRSLHRGARRCQAKRRV
jgi:hypothetical protein